MEINVKFKVKPFTVPNFVIIDRSALRIGETDNKEFVENPKLRLSDFDADELMKMCDEFTSAVFKKAGKTPPPTNCGCGR